MGNEPAARVSALVFSHDPTTLAVGAEDGTVRLWDVTSRKPLGGTLHVPAGNIEALTFSADDRTLYALGKHVPLVAYDLAPARMVTDLCAGGCRTDPSGVGDLRQRRRVPAELMSSSGTGNGVAATAQSPSGRGGSAERPRRHHRIPRQPRGAGGALGHRAPP
ncbi:hypothetical protein AB0N06_32990 [Streptomyces sp. NPDC051020]|uniref:WD40 repeat domain-containing protein n=1 Tax=Streptomyces sp. NPDC051020 TaxID=3155409 RepID=UPI0034316ED6